MIGLQPMLFACLPRGGFGFRRASFNRDIGLASRTHCWVARLGSRRGVGISSRGIGLPTRGVGR